ncbi:MAG: hypothetical protein Q4C50_03745 [Eubacteriales bacterium]|nr:hypothetical protein [Eubacteriales bacterium]
MNKKLFWEAFRLPVLVLILIVLAVTADEVLALPLPFPAALIPLAVGGGCVLFDALSSLWHTKQITTGILVVLALIGTVFTGEFMEGAEVSFMMLLGEALEDYTMKKTQLTVNELIAAIPADAYDGDSVLLSEKGNVQRLADRFSRYFLPVILGICVLVFFITWDIHRVMAILVIACPCSLVLSSPAAVLPCVGNAARHGIILPDGGTVERCGAAKSVYLDLAVSQSPGIEKAVSEMEHLGLTVVPRGLTSNENLVMTDNGLTIGFHRTADIILTGGDVCALSYTFALTRKARTIILENIFLFACLVNLAGILLSSLGLLSIVPGAILHNASSVCVILNSLRLLRWKA